MKICTKCKEEKEDWQFYTDNCKRDSLSSTCRKCHQKMARESKLHERYGITIKQYELMLKSQNGVCAICGQPEIRKINGEVCRLAIDHKHIPFKVRGLLCNDCNIQLRMLEKEDWILKAQAYLEKHK